MKKQLFLFYCLIGLMIQFSTVSSVQAQQNLWSIPLQSTVQKLGTPQINTQNAKILQFNLSEASTLLRTVPKGQSFEAPQSGFIFSIPMPDGTLIPFSIIETALMSPELAQQLPQVKTYSGTGLTDKSTYLVMDITQHGFHAMIQSHSGTVYIDPYQKGNTQYYISYWKKDFDPSTKTSTQKFCEFNTVSKQDKSETDHQHKTPNHSHEKKGNQARPSGTQLRTYRLAVAATGEYTQFHNDGNPNNGNAVADAQAAIVTTINRVKGIYEKEVGISFTLISNTSIIFEDGATDPFSNNNAGALINQSQTVIDNNLGIAAYDIGHTFSTGGGGLAGLGVVCVNGQKARGITGSDQPIGDPFDVDFVAHEIGHQFGAEHTFNGNSGDCTGGNRSSDTAYEPGSGTTIMAYAGICSPQNIQNNSDAYFHTSSYDQILDYTLDDDGNNCPTVSNTGNTPPAVNAGVGGFTIPIGTPFELTGSATDANGDALTYCWEQFDLGPAGAPNNPSGNAPLFRSFPPVSSPSRTFPRIQNIISNTQTQGEILPSYSRDMTFRLTVRDAQPVAGVNYDVINFAVSQEAGPFVVLSPNTALTWQAGSNQLVTWDVANTNLPPVNCQRVNILLSKDGGFTYPITLASEVINNGAFWIAVPNEPTTQARLKVAAADNIFFDISNQNFTITAAPSATFSLEIPQQNVFACAPDNAVIDIKLNSIGGFNSPVNLSLNNLPAGLNSAFGQNPLTPTASTTLTLSNTNAVNSGIYDVGIVATFGSTTRTIPIKLEIVGNNLGNSVLQAPLNNATGVSIRPLFSWTALPAVQNYQIKIATDENFTAIVREINLSSNSFQLNTDLSPLTRYYWRVSATNICGQNSQSETFSFVTFAVECEQYQATNLPIIINDGPPNTINAVINIPDDLTITSVRIPKIQGLHTWISDLTFVLISPTGTEVTLLNRICNNQDNFNIGFDDNAPNNNYPCPPTDGNSYRPQGNLANFIGENAQGNWVLRVIDNAAEDGGMLQNWELEICYANTGNTRPQVIQNLPLFAQPGQASYTIGSNLLQATDGEDEDDNLLYVIEETPQNGKLKKGTIDLAVGSVFLQSELNQGLIAFQPNTIGASLSNRFRFRVSDSGNLSTAITTFRIEIGFPPVVISNNGLVDIPNRAPYFINTNLLESTDVEDNNSTLTYIVTNTTQNGLLRLQGVTLQNNDNFSQADINNQRINYVPSNAQTGAQDSFKFRVRDSVGNLTQENTFSISIDVINSLAGDLLEGGTELSPNPTRGIVYLQMNFPYQGSIAIRLFSVEGKEVHTQSITKDTLQTNLALDLSGLAAGMYFLEVDTLEGKVIKRLLKY